MSRKNIKNKYPFRNWTEEEDNRLRDNYLKTNNIELGRLVNRSSKAINNRLMLLKLKRPSKYCCFTEETRKKMSKTAKLNIGEKNNFYGKCHTQQTREKISNAVKKAYNEGRLISPNKGKQFSEEKKEKTRRTRELRGLNAPEKNPFYGKHHTEETKRNSSNLIKQLYKDGKLISINKGKPLSKETKRKLSESRKKDYAEHPEMIERIKECRKKQIFPSKDSSIEVKIQEYLKLLGIDFFTHQYIKEIKHSYQCDILIPSLNMVIECDGDYWHKYPIGRELDRIRTKELFEKGFKVLRLWEKEIRIMNLEEFKIKLNK